MSDFYQVALTLHALHPDDRTWLLSQLSSAEIDAIEAIVARDDSQPVGETHKFDLAVAREALQHRSLPDSVSQLITLDATQIAPVLKHEPDWVIAGILEAYRWPWHIAVLDLLEPERKKNITHLRKDAFRLKLIESLLQKLYARACTVTAQSFSTGTSGQSFPSQKTRTRLSMKGIRRWLP